MHGQRGESQWAAASCIAEVVGVGLHAALGMLSCMSKDCMDLFWQLALAPHGHDQY